MFVSTLFHIVYCALVHQAAADVKLVSPASGSSVAGGAMTLRWQDSGANPALVAIAAADIILCTGTDAAPTTLYTLAGSVAMGTLSSLAVTIPVTIGTNGQYFLKFVETTATGNVVTTYSDRFTLTGMTGNAVANVGLAAAAPIGTTPAAALLETAAATALKKTTATTNAATPTADVDAVLAPYMNQVGAIRSAPPMSKPGTRITADLKSPDPLFPKSAFTVFTVAGAAPVARTTVTASPSWTVVSLENGVAPASETPTAAA